MKAQATMKVTGTKNVYEASPGTVKWAKNYIIAPCLCGCNSVKVLFVNEKNELFAGLSLENANEIQRFIELLMVSQDLPGRPN